MEINFTLTKEDVIQYNRYIYKYHQPIRRKVRWMYVYTFLLPTIFVVALDMARTRSMDLDPEFLRAGLIGSCIGLLIFRLFLEIVIRLSHLKYENHLCSHSLLIDEEGVHEKNHMMEGTFKWPVFTKIDRDSSNIYFFVQKKEALVIPIGAFTSSEHAMEFFQKAQALWNGAQENKPAV